MDDNESLTDLEVDQPPKLTFEEVKQQIFLEPGLIKEKKDILKAVYYYTKDSKSLHKLSRFSLIDWIIILIIIAKKHSRIIKYLFWPLIISFVQEGSNNKISLFGLRLLNTLIANEATHE